MSSVLCLPTPLWPFKITSLSNEKNYNYKVVIARRTIEPVVWSRQASESVSSVSLKSVLGCKIVRCKEMKVEMYRLKTLSAYCAFLFLTIKLCDLILIWFKSLYEGCHYCCRAAEIHPVVCSTFLLWWDWKKRLPLFLQMGNQDIKLWVFRSARIKELPFHCSRGLRGLVFTPWVCHLSPRWSSGCHKPFFFLCQHYFNLDAAVQDGLYYTEVLVDTFE